MVRLILVLSAASLLAMIAIDRALGTKAEFMNAWSVVERLLGRTPSSGDSMLASRFGAFAELLAVIAANAAIGLILSFAVIVLGKVLR